MANPYLANARPVRTDYVSCGCFCGCGGDSISYAPAGLHSHCGCGFWGGVIGGVLSTILCNLGSFGSGWGFGMPTYSYYKYPRPSLFMPMMPYANISDGYMMTDTFHSSSKRTHRRHSSSSSVTSTETPSSSNTTNNTTIVINTKNSDGTVTTKEVKVKTPSDIAALSDDEFNSLLDDAEAAKATLNALGYVEDGIVKKLPAPSSDTFGKMMRLIQASQLQVQVARNPKATADNCMIRGMITDLTVDQDGKVDFVINNSAIDEDYGLMYHFVQKTAKGNDFYIKSITNLKKDDFYINNNWITPPSIKSEQSGEQNNEVASGSNSTQFTTGSERIYTYSSSNGLLNIDTKPLISKNPQDGYTKIEKNKSYLKSEEGRSASEVDVHVDSNGTIQPGKKEEEQKS